jgi:ABC-type branched-subunit amino acid transport system substrate-binding protein
MGDVRPRVVARLGSAVLCCALVLSGCASEVPPGDFVAFGAPARAATPGVAAVVRVPGGPAAPATASTSTASGGLPVPGATSAAATVATPGMAAGASPVGSITQLHHGSCAGFRNTDGITDTTIPIGNIADLSGPVPGLFSSAQQATMAYAAYFNATSTICGRTLKVTGYDSQTSAIGDQQAATSACNDTFAVVGSVSAFDNGGASTVADCGIPDLRTISTTPERVASPVSFGTDAVDPTLVSTAQWRFIKSATGDAYQHTAVIYLDAGAAVPNADAYHATLDALGFNIVYVQPIDVTAFNYAPYAAKLKSLGVTFVQFEGAAPYAVRLKQAMQVQGVNPVFVMDSVAYDPAFVASGGTVLNGMYSYVDTSLFEDASSSPAVQLYTQWLHRVAPAARPSFFGMFAWGAMQLFTSLAVQLGGKLDRSALLAAIRATHGFTADGLFAPQDVGGKVTSGCQAVIQLENGQWVRRSARPYVCADVFDSNR